MQPKPEIVLSVDPGLTHTGVALFVNIRHRQSRSVPFQIASCKPQKTWLLQLPVKGSWESKCIRMSDLLVETINGNVDGIRLCSIDKCLIESQQFWSASSKSVAATSSGNIFKLSVLCGCFFRALVDRSVDCEFVSPGDWKGQTPKDVIESRVCKICNYSKVQDHVADAIGIGLWYQGVL